MSDICSAASWSSPHTFVRFYRLDSTTPSVAQSVLSAGSTIQPHLFSPVNSSARDISNFSSLNFGLLLYSSRPAGRPSAVLHQTTWIITEVRYIHNHTKRTSADNQSRISPDFKCVSFDCDYSVCSSAFDRVLELTSNNCKPHIKELLKTEAIMTRVSAAILAKS